MSEFVVVAVAPGNPAPDLERRASDLAAFLRLDGSSLATTVHRLGTSALVDLSTGRPVTTTAAALDHLRRCTGATLRDDDGATVLETPLVTGRTLWRLRSGDLDLVSTSMRALAFLDGSTDPDPEAAAWMLLSGSLGPSRSWDRRIRQVGPASHYVLGTSLARPRPLPTPPRLSHREWEAELDRRLRAVIDDLDLDPDDWGLPLSGGVDSRGLAVALGGRLPTFTWGSPATHSDPGSDLAVAVRVADALGLRHRTIELAPGSVDATTVLDRFAMASECRTDNLGGYVDGMQLWRDLRAAGITGIVRGDEVFGWVRRTDSPSTRISTGALFAGDVAVSAELRESVEELASGQTVPPWLLQEPGEGLADYRDRLYRRFRAPSILSALTQTKSGYVDVTNPYLSDELVELVLGLPERLRTDKRLFTSYVTARSQGIPFAQRSSVPPSSNFLDRADTLAVLRGRLTGRELAGVPGELLERLTAPERPSSTRATSTGRSGTAVGWVRKLVPHAVRREYAIRQMSRPTRLDDHQLLFRTFLVSAGLDQLRAAASAGSATGSP